VGSVVLVELKQLVLVNVNEGVNVWVSVLATKVAVLVETGLIDKDDVIEIVLDIGGDILTDIEVVEVLDGFVEAERVGDCVGVFDRPVVFVRVVLVVDVFERSGLTEMLELIEDDFDCLLL